MSSGTKRNLSGVENVVTPQLQVKRTKLNAGTDDSVILTLPATSGALALSSDIPDSSTFATLTGVQTLTNKTLTTPIISSISNAGILSVPTGGGTIAKTSDLTPYATKTGVETLTNKTLEATTTTFQNTNDFLKIVPDNNNSNGTNQLNVLFNTTTPNLTHTLRFGNGTAPAVNTQWSLDPNGGFLPNTTNSQTISGSWGFTNGTAATTIGQGPLVITPTGNQNISGSNSYYWTTFRTPNTVGPGTGGSVATLRVEGAPNNNGDNEDNTDAIRCNSGSIRTAGEIIAGAGSLSVPALRMSDIASGFYRPAANQIAAVANGSTIMTIKATSTHVVITGDLSANNCSFGSVTGTNLTAGSGTVGAPSIRMTDATSGFFRPAANQVATVCSGATVQNVTSTGVDITGNATTTGSLRVGSLGSTSANIRSGTFTFSSSSLLPDTGQFSLAPSFGVTFSAAPRVWVSLDIKNFTNGIVLHPTIQAVSTTGFTFTIWNTSNSLTYVGGVIDAYWLAIG